MWQDVLRVRYVCVQEKLVNVFRCVDCGYEGPEFSVEVGGSYRGAFTYLAKCPNCGSLKVNPLPGYESDIRIGVRDDFLPVGESH